MEPTYTVVPYLALATLIIAIAFGIWQYMKTRKAQREKHHSADAKVHGDRPVQR